jgi:hypothetical protein
VLAGQLIKARVEIHHSALLLLQLVEEAVAPTVPSVLLAVLAEVAVQ